MKRHLASALFSAAALAALSTAQPASAEALRLLTWGGYAPDSVIQKFEEKYPDIDACRW